MDNENRYDDIKFPKAIVTNVRESAMQLWDDGNAFVYFDEEYNLISFVYDREVLFVLSEDTVKHMFETTKRKKS